MPHRPPSRLRPISATRVLLALIGLWNVWIIVQVIHPSNNDARPSDLLAIKGKRGSLKRGERKRPNHVGNMTSMQRQRKQPKDAPCVRLDCIQRKAESLARSFISSRNQTWSLPPPSMSLFNGLLYVKVPKTGSSTIAGAALRVAKTHHVPVHYDHSSGQEYAFHRRNMGNSFLFTSVRDPAQRALSYIAYESSRTQRSKVLAVSTLLESLRSMDRLGAVQKSEGRGGIQLAFTSHIEIPKHSAWKPSFPEYVVRVDRVEQNVVDVLDAYNFLLVTERMEESLVALAMLLGVPVRDVLVFSSKRAWRRGNANNQAQEQEPGYLPIHDKGGGMSCVPLVHLSNETLNDPQVISYLKSDEWHAMMYGDYLLHMAANLSLDRTIQDFGEEDFRENLEEFQHLIEKADRTCRGQVQGPCSSNGTIQWKESSENCYAGDYGCGYKCIDKIFQDPDV